ncbi:hypothetical protein MtrunA17_Chr7g0218141 [Medicago truncatula]|uniref:Transmembrane protein n=1 Tax=Medicago truncatula TaxID=3880 RepID=A0A396GXY6_MEDTR|nr:hypothetical protein MtrunA17_Chr7g0218141 [Medicago truncatula]
MWVVEVIFVAVVTMFEDFGTTYVYVVSLIVVLALFWCFYLLILEIAICLGGVSSKFLGFFFFDSQVYGFSIRSSPSIIYMLLL